MADRFSVRCYHSFKVPTLRSIALTASYFRYWSEQHLANVVDKMVRVQLGQTLTRPQVAMPQLPASDANSTLPER